MFYSNIMYHFLSHVYIYLWTKQIGADVYDQAATRSKFSLSLGVNSHFSSMNPAFNTATLSLKQEYISFITDNSYVKLSGD